MNNQRKRLSRAKLVSVRAGRPAQNKKHHHVLWPACNHVIHCVTAIKNGWRAV